MGEKGEKQGEINLIGRRAPCVLIVSCVQRDEEHKVRTRNDKKRSAQTTATTTHTQQDILGEKFVVVASDHDIINIIRRFSSREGKRAVDVKKKLFPSTGATHTHTRIITLGHPATQAQCMFVYKARGSIGRTKNFLLFTVSFSCALRVCWCVCAKTEHQVACFKIGY